MRAVLDTNVLVSALLFRGAASRLRVHWRARALTLVASPETLGELVRVLAYPKFKLTAELVNGVLAAEVLPFVEVVAATDGESWCRDADDDRFVWGAMAARADALVTGGGDLLALRPSVLGIPVLTIAEALARLGPAASPE